MEEGEEKQSTIPENKITQSSIFLLTVGPILYQQINYFILHPSIVGLPSFALSFFVSVHPRLGPRVGEVNDQDELYKYEHKATNHAKVPVEHLRNICKYHMKMHMLEHNQLP